MQHPRSPLLVLSIASLVVAAALYASLSVLSDPFAVEFAR